MSGGDAFDVLARLTPALLIVLGGPFAVRWVIRRGPGAAPRRMRVLERVPMGKSAQAVIVTVADRTLLLGVTESQVTLLSELDPETQVASTHETAPPNTVGMDAGTGLQAATQPWDGFVERWRHMTTRRPSKELTHVYER